ncbi:Fructokinase-2 [Acorus gramineus]|uniref:Fructokinase-2 n=1 Tax=Acorus gramineus TaxID=55184 RepID=A0AAV9B637_ACOGR|nr:Fructokinase-2 [Acorus gramineus]
MTITKEAPVADGGGIGGEGISHHAEEGLVVGNYCHDVLYRDGRVIGEGLGGAASFTTNVLDALSLPVRCVSRVGSDFAYLSSVSSHPPIFSSSTTTLFHAYFIDDNNDDDVGRRDRVLKRVRSCDPISPSDLPGGRMFSFGLAVGVGGEISPETLERMLDLCRVVFVDIQALIRVFDDEDGGTVRLVPLRDSGFSHLLPRIGFLKASAEESPLIEIEEARKHCCVIITDGKDGCTVYWKDGELRVPSFPAVQIDPTGAGDSFLGGLVTGMAHGFTVAGAALLGNFFGSLTVAQIGVPKFNPSMLQIVKGELSRKTIQHSGICEGREIAAEPWKSEEYNSFRVCLQGATEMMCGHKTIEQRDEHEIARQQKILLSSAYDEMRHVNNQEKSRIIDLH